MSRHAAAYETMGGYRCPAVLGVLLGMLVALASPGCAEDSRNSSPVVAVAGGSEITRAQYLQELRRQNRAYAETREVKRDRFFVPPDFETCRSDETRSTEPGLTMPAESRRRCAERYERLKVSALESLIALEWWRQEAPKWGVAASATDNAAILQAKVTRKAEKAAARPTSDQIGRYYTLHKRYFRQPERRDILMLTAQSRAKARAARAALMRGESWTVAARIATAQPGRAMAQGRSDLGVPLGAAVFEVDEGEISPPLGTAQGWVIFTVTRVRAPFQMSLNESGESIRSFLAGNAAQRRHYRFLDEVTRAYRAKTRCFGSVKSSLCSNAPLAASRPAVSFSDQLRQPLLPVVTRPVRATQRPHWLDQSA